MTYGEVKAQFLAMLNRRDITPSQVEAFLKHSLQRAQRLLRVPASESEFTSTVLEGFTGLDVPGDYLKLVSLCVDDGAPLARASLTQARLLAQTDGTPTVFHRDRFKFIIGSRPKVGSVIRLIYLADFTALANDSDTNFLTEIAWDVVVSGAMSFACKHFVDPRGDGYEQKFLEGLQDLNNQAFEDELTNAQIEPAYALDFDF
jgi:hypothetical protein